MNDSFETSSIGTPLDSREGSRLNVKEQSDSHSDSSAGHSDNESVNGGLPNKIDIKSISPPQSPRSVQNEEASPAKDEPKKPSQVRRRKNVLDDEVVKTKVDDLLAKIDSAVREDRDLILRKKPGSIIRPTETSTHPRTREIPQGQSDRREVSPVRRTGSLREHDRQATQQLLAKLQLQREDATDSDPTSSRP